MNHSLPRRLDTPAALTRWLAEAAPEVAPGVALYASAGDDTRALTFTHPEFLRDRDVPEVPECGLYVLVDRAAPRHGQRATLEFVDERTTIATTHAERIWLCGFEAHLLHLAVYSDTRADRSLCVVRVNAHNEAFASALRRFDFVPDLFIGVTDGCRFGRNRHCVNHLTTWGLPPQQLAKLRIPRWWITDHFFDVELCDPCPAGTLITSREPDFPWAFRKRALLSSQWGTYNERPLGGATLFEVEPAPRTAQ